MFGYVRFDPSNPAHVAELRRVEAGMVAPHGIHCFRLGLCHELATTPTRRPVHRRPAHRRQSALHQAIRDGLAFLAAARSSTVVHEGGIARVHYVRAQLEALPPDACPCRGPDPGPWHLPQCTREVQP